ncbi:MAG: hypothetical protein R3C01_10085 [Planctomycetaceae bacterium]
MEGNCLQVTQFPTMLLNKLPQLMTLRLPPLLWLVCLMAGSLTASAHGEGVTFQQVTVGIDGAYKLGRWTPVRVEFDQPLPEGSRVTVSTRDADGNRAVVTLEAEGDRQYRGLTISGRTGTAFRFDVHDAATPSKVIASQSITPGGESGVMEYRQGTNFWLLIGTHPGFVEAVDLLNPFVDETREQRSELDVVQRLVQPLSISADQLPTRFEEYDAIHSIVLERGDLTAPQAAALEQWVNAGGNLMVVAGRHARTFREGPLASWLPVHTGERLVERRTTELLSSISAAIVNGARLLSFEELTVTPLQPHAGQTEIEGSILIKGPSDAIAVRAAYGLGTISVVGLDLMSPPFAESTDSNVADSTRNATPSDAVPPSHGSRVLWSGLPKLCLVLMGQSRTAIEADTLLRSNNLKLSGVSDLQTQLNGIVEEFPTINRMTTGQVIGLMALWLLVAGPLDYLLVHRILKRPYLTWLTLPVWIVVASWMATRAADRINTSPLETNQIDLVDIAVDTGSYRTTTWFSFYSSSSKRYVIDWKPADWSSSNSPVPPGNTSNGPTSSESSSRIFGMLLPEEGFRGMYRQGGMSMADVSYNVAPFDGRLTQLPVDLWSTRAIMGEQMQRRSSPPDSASGDGESATQATSPLAESHLRIERLRAGGRNYRDWSLTQRLSHPIRDWFIVTESQVIYPTDPEGPLAVLHPGETYNLMSGTSKPQLKTFVQGASFVEIKKSIGSEKYSSATSYDPNSHDLDRLMKTLSFFRTIGGESYTGLTNTTLDKLDLSEFAHLGRAVLVGRLDVPGSEFLIDGQAHPRQRSETFVRLLIPVTREFQLQDIHDENDPSLRPKN